VGGPEIFTSASGRAFAPSSIQAVHAGACPPAALTAVLRVSSVGVAEVGPLLVHHLSASPRAQQLCSSHLARGLRHRTRSATHPVPCIPWVLQRQATSPLHHLPVLPPLHGRLWGLMLSFKPPDINGS
jgi:hypothetical protein